MLIAFDIGDEHVAVASTEASRSRSAAVRRGFGPLKRARRDCSPRRSNTAKTVPTPWAGA